MTKKQITLSERAIRHLLSFIPGASVIVLAIPLAAQTPATLKVGLVTRGNSGATTASTERGARLGAAEAKQTANLFGADVLLFVETATGTPEQAAQKLLGERQIQVLVASSAQDVDALSRFAESHRLIFFNVASRATSLRAACRHYTFHVEASDSMYADAASAAASPRGTPASQVLLWSPVLEKYGASQINDRFRARYHLSMDSGAWAAWFALKAAAEALLRVQSPRVDAIRDYLDGSRTSFDGHKGWPLSFRATDHQLRQPLYVVSGPSAPGRANPGVREIPPLNAIAVAGNSPGGAARILDTLMPKSAARCAWMTR